MRTCLTLSKNFFLSLILLATAMQFAQVNGQQYQVEWVDQFGTDSDEAAHGIAVHSSGDIFLSGRTGGTLGASRFGLNDQFIQRRDSDGNIQWTTQIGSSANDFSQDISIGSAGVFSVGYQVSSGSFDATASLTDFNGNLQWSRTYGSASFDIGHGAASGNGFHMLAGSTESSLGSVNAGDEDALLTRFDDSGSIVWEAQWGTNQFDRLLDVDVDSLGNSYVVGQTDGSFSTPGAPASSDDVFISMVSATGNVLWTEQFGTFGQDLGRGIFHENGAVYVTGAGQNQNFAFVRKYDTNGTFLWESQINEFAGFEAIEVNSLGEIIAVGDLSSLGGRNSQDAFAVKLDSSGNEVWRYEFGSDTQPEWVYDVAVDGTDFYLVGQTRDTILGQSSFGSDDAFVVKFSAVPEPSCFSLLLVLFGTLASRRQRDK